jgi:hypothetical protein
MMTGFKVMGNRGFHITFENGVTVSVQFGGGNYCSNHNDFDLLGHELERRVVESFDAEIAIWKRGGQWITKEFKNSADDVLGWQSPSDILEALNWAKARGE